MLYSICLYLTYFTKRHPSKSIHVASEKKIIKKLGKGLFFLVVMTETSSEGGRNWKQPGSKTLVMTRPPPDLILAQDLGNPMQC